MFFKDRNVQKRAKSLLQELSKAIYNSNNINCRSVGYYRPSITVNIYTSQDVRKLQPTRAILDECTDVQIAVIHLAIDQFAKERIGKVKASSSCSPGAACAVTSILMVKKLPYSEDDFVRILKGTSKIKDVATWNTVYLNNLVSTLEQFFKDQQASDRVVSACKKLIQALENRYCNSADQKIANRLDLICKGPRGFPIDDGEAWSDQALQDLNALDPDQKILWSPLMEHCTKSMGSNPSGRWLKTASKHLEAVTFQEFKKYIFSWFALVDKPRTKKVESWSEWEPDPNQLIIDEHKDILKGLSWYCSIQEDKDVARALSALALSTYKKVPMIGPRAVKVGNACIGALGAMPGMDGIGLLALLKARIKSNKAQLTIEKAMSASAQRIGVSHEELEEITVPTYELRDVGFGENKFGDYISELHIKDSSSVEMRWRKPEGKYQKSVPASVKANDADKLKSWKQTSKDIQKMLPAQRERLDKLNLQQKSWNYSYWRKHFLDHPLVGTLTRRLIWNFESDGLNTSGIYLDRKMVDRQGGEINNLDDHVTVTMWHPLQKDKEDVLGWRDWLEQHEIQQPFKQAHREVYLLTDAEITTDIYSNRFASHILRQHQFNALCGARGWRNQLQLLVDADFPPATLYLPNWKLRAEFWVDGIGGGFGDDTNDTGTFHYLSTDQVRFYTMEESDQPSHASRGGLYARNQQEVESPVPLKDIPPLVLSEVLRDVDLFVGVASVGNDPNWSDGGPNGQYRDYWTSYAFGNLGESAKTRKVVLEKLIPRLKIADRCKLDDKFLIVRGDIRTYKIHCGSGNIMMEPNDQYLCIVPGRQQVSRSSKEKVYLPFEGDSTMAIILSKAFLLADDKKITDKTIISQLQQQ